MRQSPVLLIFGFGYVASHLARRLNAHGGWEILATARSHDSERRCHDAGVACFAYDALRDPAWWERHGHRLTHVLSAIPPGEEGDPVIHAAGARFRECLTQAAWLGYLSTTGVYGDHGGAWVGEDHALKGATARIRRRIRAEEQWLELWRQAHLPVHVFRLAGIYGPRRNVLEDLKRGEARAVKKDGHVFSRVHVADIVQALELSMNRPYPGEIFNLADDMPSASQDVLADAAALLGVPMPAPMPVQDLPEDSLLREFFSASRRVSNLKAKRLLGWELQYPTYHQGLAHEWAAMNGN